MDRYNLHHGDCLEIMPEFQDESVDMVLCDLPYGTSACRWDQVIPFEPLWQQYKRIIKKNGAIVLFGQEPFSSCLRCSNLEMYKYDWIWQKPNAANYLNKRRMPGKITENISVFSFGKCSANVKYEMSYFPILKEDKPYFRKQAKNSQPCAIRSTEVENFEYNNHGYRYPNNILPFAYDSAVFHPTQKPVALLEYLIKTYTNEDDMVLDNCMGSGSTGVACVNTRRKFIGIEKNEEYFNIATKRIIQAEKQYQEFCTQGWDKKCYSHKEQIPQPLQAGDSGQMRLDL